MTLVLNGTSTSATAPAVVGDDLDTGVYYPAANQVALATNGTQALLANSSQGVQISNTLGVGNATPSTSGAGITFPASQSASSDANTLDDYEEGTWTPAFVGSSGFTGFVAENATYRKIGSLVWVRARITFTAVGSSTNISLTGLPFTSAALNYFCGAGREDISVGWCLAVQTNASSTSVGLNYYDGAAFNSKAGTGFNFFVLYQV